MKTAWPASEKAEEEAETDRAMIGAVGPAPVDMGVGEMGEATS